MAYIDERTQKFLDNIISGASNEELFKVEKPQVVQRDPMSEAIVSFGPALLGAITGESGALAAPGAAKQAREYYDTNLKNQQEVANKAAEMANKQREKALELNLKVDKEIADRDYKTQALAQQLDISKSNQDLKQELARAQLAASAEGRASRQAQEKNLPQNVYQAATFSQRVEDANKQIEDIMSGGYDPTSIKQTLLNKISPEVLKGSQAKLMEQAQRNYINAILRRESGAAISPSEFENAEKQYFPQIGDSAEVVAQKKRNREVALAGLKTEGAKALEKMQPNLPTHQKTEQPQSVFTEEKAKRLAELRAKKEAGKLGQ